MAKEEIEKRTVVVIPEDPDELAVVSTFNRRWINRLEKLAGEGKAEEVESSVDGAREFEFDRRMLKMPFSRTPRVWTEEEREEARQRLAQVREAVMKSRKAKAKVAPAKKGKKKVAPPPPKTTVVKKGKKPAPKARMEVREDELEEEEDYEEEEELEEEEEEMEEVVVKKPAKKPIRK